MWHARHVRRACHCRLCNVKGWTRNLRRGEGARQPHKRRPRTSILKIHFDGRARAYALTATLSWKIDTSEWTSSLGTQNEWSHFVANAAAWSTLKKGRSGSSVRPNSGTTKSAAWPTPTGAPMGRSRSPRCTAANCSAATSRARPRRSAASEARSLDNCVLNSVQAASVCRVIIREGARHLHPSRRHRSEDVLDVRARFDPRRNESGECKTDSPPEAQPTLRDAECGLVEGTCSEIPAQCTAHETVQLSSCSFSASSLTSCPAVRKRCTDQHTSAHARPQVSSVAGSFTSAKAECKAPSLADSFTKLKIHSRSRTRNGAQNVAIGVGRAHLASSADALSDPALVDERG